MLKSHRLFVGNIPKGTTEEELNAEFCAYGVVESIEIKQKSNPASDVVDIFGFVTLQADDYTVHCCIKEFSEQKYKGVYLNVSKAKESFLDRLKREREEAEALKESAASLEPYKKLAVEENVAKSPEKLPTLPTISKSNESSSSESSESESEDEEEPSRGNQTITNRQPIAKPEGELVRKWNQETYIEHGKLKIIPITGQVADVIDRSKSRQKQSEGKKLGEQARIADEKRKQGLTKLKTAYEQQKNAIKSALSGDSVNNKRKIAFSDDEDDEEGSSTKPKLSLFNGQDDDDGFEGNFSVRNQLEGQEGQKLHEMQTTYHADNRFRLDSRFLDHDDKTKGERKPQENINDKDRRKQLEILSNVTGKTLGEKRNDSKKAPQMQRFDPSQKEKTDQDKAPEKPVNMDELKKAERPEEEYKVSEQKFYVVSDELLNSIKGSAARTDNNEGFSLLSMFGRPAEDNPSAEVTNEDVYEADEEMPLQSDAKFKYESSDSEEENQAVEDHKNRMEQFEDGKSNKQTKENDKEKDESWRENVAQRKAGYYYSRQGIWKENFFFLPDDVRFDEGRKFFGIHSVPAGESATGETREPNAEETKGNVKDIRKIFKKRRQREEKIVRTNSKRVFKMMKKRTLRK
ncbi:probable RNA-binding protein CG14230 [Anopheles ziemanni]|uniref:probable RNA-binding protein CG14230 isoform X1 n=1 Tax=Anopheles coustani TaxID=139045 RepID=UPI00265A85E9|nr:probable RNA-binding protein CG14230 isoform X1 [Anopheles coustani]XP_058172177.1 probable RNA-binding protein CG14230 [Anopheles ziemanni]